MGGGKSHQDEEKSLKTTFFVHDTPKSLEVGDKPSCSLKNKKNKNCYPKIQYSVQYMHIVYIVYKHEAKATKRYSSCVTVAYIH